jgi:uncharacterized membrane protein YraQ (UPF0718 family)
MPTLLEVPIVWTLFGHSSGVMSLPNMIVILRVKGARKAGVYISLVRVPLSTLVGMIYGAIV